MDKVELAVEKTFDLIDDDCFLDYSKIYTRSNENLPALFKCFDVRGKDVLTVLASADQYFSAWYLGARSVDSFDVNRLTEFYYYLRYWLIKYRGKYFFDRKEILESNKWLTDLLREVNCINKAEDDAYRYWEKIASLSPDILGDYLFYPVRDYYDPVVKDCRMLLDILKDRELNFIAQDIGLTVDKSKKYDVVILSNILEYNSSKDILKRCRDNLYDILKNNGEIICSSLTKLSVSEYQNDIFLEKFDTLVFPKNFTSYFDEGISIWYRYKKKQ